MKKNKKKIKKKKKIKMKNKKIFNPCTYALVASSQSNESNAVLNPRDDRARFGVETTVSDNHPKRSIKSQ